MAGVFKAGRGYYYPVQPTTDTVVIDNSIKVKPVAPQISQISQISQIPQGAAEPDADADNTEINDQISERHRQELEQKKKR